MSEINDDERIVSKEHGEILNAMTKEQKQAVHAWTIEAAKFLVQCFDGGYESLDEFLAEGLESNYDLWCHDE